MSEGEANLALMELDRGLRSVNLSDQCQAIVKFLNFFDKYPFPIFINSAYLKLADLFRSGSNFVRYLIYIIVKQSNKHTEKILNLDEFLKRIFTLSYSNDPIARAITLKLLASISKVISEKTNVHQFIQNGLNSHESIEAEAAIYACKSFCKESNLFSTNICLKLNEMIQNLNIPLKIKLKLIPLFQYIYHDNSSFEQSFSICENLLEKFPTEEFTMLILHTLTMLVFNAQMKIHKQIKLLLEKARAELRLKVILRCLLDVSFLLDNVKSFDGKSYSQSLGLKQDSNVLNDEDDAFFDEILGNTITENGRLTKDSFKINYLKSDYVEDDGDRKSNGVIRNSNSSIIICDDFSKHIIIDLFKKYVDEFYRLRSCNSTNNLPNSYLRVIVCLVNISKRLNIFRDEKTSSAFSSPPPPSSPSHHNNDNGINNNNNNNDDESRRINCAIIVECERLLHYLMYNDDNYNNNNFDSSVADIDQLLPRLNRVSIKKQATLMYIGAQALELYAQSHVSSFTAAANNNNDDGLHEKGRESFYLDLFDYLDTYLGFWLLNVQMDITYFMNLNRLRTLMGAGGDANSLLFYDTDDTLISNNGEAALGNSQIHLEKSSSADDSKRLFKLKTIFASHNEIETYFNNLLNVFKYSIKKICRLLSTLDVFGVSKSRDNDNNNLLREIYRDLIFTTITDILALHQYLPEEFTDDNARKIQLFDKLHALASDEFFLPVLNEFFRIYYELAKTRRYSETDTLQIEYTTTTTTKTDGKRESDEITVLTNEFKKTLNGTQYCCYDSSGCSDLKSHEATESKNIFNLNLNFNLKFSLTLARVLFLLIPDCTGDLFQSLSTAVATVVNDEEPPRNFNFWIMYKLATIAMRYGHHKCAYTLLTVLKNKVSSFNNTLWLESLYFTSLAESSLQSYIKNASSVKQIEDTDKQSIESSLITSFYGFEKLKMASMNFPLKFKSTAESTVQQHHESALTDSEFGTLGDKITPLSFQLKFSELRYKTLDWMKELQIAIRGLITMPPISFDEFQLQDIQSSLGKAAITPGNIQLLINKKSRLYKRRFQHPIRGIKRLIRDYRHFYHSSYCFDCDPVSLNIILEFYVNRLTFFQACLKEFVSSILPLTSSILRNHYALGSIEPDSRRFLSNFTSFKPLYQGWKDRIVTTLHCLNSSDKKIEISSSIATTDDNGLLQTFLTDFWQLFQRVFSQPLNYPPFYFVCRGTTYLNLHVNPQAKKASPIVLLRSQLTESPYYHLNPKDPSTYVSSKVDSLLVVNVEGIVVYPSNNPNFTSTLLPTTESSNHSTNSPRRRATKIRILCFYRVAKLPQTAGTEQLLSTLEDDDSFDKYAEESGDDPEENEYAPDDKDIQVKHKRDTNSPLNYVQDDVTESSAYQSMAQLYVDIAVLKTREKMRDDPGVYVKDIPINNDYFNEQFLLDFPIVGYYTVKIECSIIDSKGKIWNTGPYTQIHVKIV